MKKAFSFCRLHVILRESITIGGTYEEILSEKIRTEKIGTDKKGSESHQS